MLLGSPRRRPTCRSRAMMRAPAGRRRRRPRRSRRRQRGLVHRRRRHQPHHQQRPPLDRAQAPRAAHAPTRSEIIERLEPQAAPRSTGITVYLQAVQDLQIDSRVSRTQYQYTLEDADPDELADWAPQMLERLQRAARAARRRQRPAGRRRCSSTLVIDRDTASRLAITAQAIDDTLYDAFGQRQVSTIFTQLNLYRVILEVDARVPAEPRRARRRSTCARRPASAVPLSAVRALSSAATRRSPSSHQGQFPAVTLSFNLAPGVALGDAVDAIRRGERAIGRAARRCTPTSRAPRGASASRWRASRS